MIRTHAFYALSAAIVLAACAQSGLGAGDEDEGSDNNTNPTTTGGTATGTGGSGTAGAGNVGASGGGGAGGMAEGGTGGDASGGAGGTGGGQTSTTTGPVNMCLHDVCTEGVALTMGCGDPCVDTVCNSDPYCCDQMGGEWDGICVDEAVQLCNAMCVIGPGPITPGDLVITEIMNNPAQVADSAGEWFEIYNDSGITIDLLGLQIAHQANNPSSVETITSSVVLQPGDYAVLGLNSNTATNGNVALDYQYSSMVNLNNTADYIAILDANNTVIDAVSYDEASGLDPNGASRTLNPLFQAASMNDTDTNFCAATSTMVGGTDLGTPGAANDACP